MDGKIVFGTPWFEIITRPFPGSDSPHYSLRARDYVTVVALTPEMHLVLVRQFRPSVGRPTLELPSGHVEDGDTPEVAARKELLEETGYVADRFDFLGQLCPDTGRMANRLWCFLAANARRTSDQAYQPEAGIEPVLFEGTLADLLAQPEFENALNYAVLLLALPRGGLAIPIA